MRRPFTTSRPPVGFSSVAGLRIAALRELSPVLKQIPKPFQLNVWKHHLRSIKEMKTEGLDEAALAEQLLAVGGRPHDIYTGALSLAEIADELGAQIKEAGAFEPAEFESWLGPKQHRTLKASDHSAWVFRLGTQADRHVHIHPGRHTPHSVRFNALAWKTAVLAFFKIETRAECSLEAINRLRVEVLELSPINDLVPREGISRALDLIYRAT
ncbi:MAG: hypothetical protein ACI8UO_004200 [Verrucomicrobiales bacterium]